MVQAYDSDLGRIVKLSGPFEVEVLRSISKLNAPSRLGVRGTGKRDGGGCDRISLGRIFFSEIVFHRVHKPASCGGRQLERLSASSSIVQLRCDQAQAVARIGRVAFGHIAFGLAAWLAAHPPRKVPPFN